MRIGKRKYTFDLHTKDQVRWHRANNPMQSFVLAGKTLSFAGLTFGNMQAVFGISAFLLFMCTYAIQFLFKNDAKCKDHKGLIKDLFGTVR